MARGAREIIKTLQFSTLHTVVGHCRTLSDIVGHYRTLSDTVRAGFRIFANGFEGRLSTYGAGRGQQRNLRENFDTIEILGGCLRRAIWADASAGQRGGCLRQDGGMRGAPAGHYVTHDILRHMTSYIKGAV